MGIQVMGKMGIGMQCWNGNGLEWELLDGSGKGMGTRKSFPHTSSSRPSDHYFRSVCWFVCLCRVFRSHLSSDFDQTRIYVLCLGLVVSPRI